MKAKTLGEFIEDFDSGGHYNDCAVFTDPERGECDCWLKRIAVAVSKATIEACMPEECFYPHDQPCQCGECKEAAAHNACRSEMKRLADRWLGEGGV